MEVKREISGACRNFDLYTSPSVAAALSESPSSARWLTFAFVMITISAWLLMLAIVWGKKFIYQRIQPREVTLFEMATAALPFSPIPPSTPNRGFRNNAGIGHQSYQGYQTVADIDDDDAVADGQAENKKVIGPTVTLKSTGEESRIAVGGAGKKPETARVVHFYNV